ncbi:hypothetical protein ACAW74_07135 [Fibrella sp. WM1]|uniref:hypothetical protein n=1 Tax=Fibrella musci TaxID=3242485 RepID=UPI0035209E8D
MTIVDKEAIKQALIEMAVNEPEFVSSLVVEVTDILQRNKRQRLEQIVEEDFTEYETVFRKLA